MKIYLAGKVSKNDWRHQIVGHGLRAANGNGDWRDERIAFGDGHIYTGPFFVGCDHGCSHFMGEHGVTRGMCEEYEWSHGDPWQERKVRGPGPDIANGENELYNATRISLINKCIAAIDDSDLVFAWLDDPTAYGTIWELGYATGSGIQTAVGIDDSTTAKHPDMSELWFAIYGCRQAYRASTPQEALMRSVATVDTKELFLKCQSPIEKQLLTELLRQRDARVSIIPQYQVMGYRLDFALCWGTELVAVECDGHNYHERTKEQAKHDRSRDRALQAAGWIVCRFTGSEIHADAARCAREALAFLERSTAAE